MKPNEKESKAVEVGLEVEGAPPCAVVIFGASGDLTKRKLIPALYNKAKHSVLPEQLLVEREGVKSTFDSFLLVW